MSCVTHTPSFISPSFSTLFSVPVSFQEMDNTGYTKIKQAHGTQDEDEEDQDDDDDHDDEEKEGAKAKKEMTNVAQRVVEEHDKILLSISCLKSVRHVILDMSSIKHHVDVYPPEDVVTITQRDVMNAYEKQWNKIHRYMQQREHTQQHDKKQERDRDRSSETKTERSEKKSISNNSHEDEWKSLVEDDTMRNSSSNNNGHDVRARRHAHAHPSVWLRFFTLPSAPLASPCLSSLRRISAPYDVEPVFDPSSPSLPAELSKLHVTNTM